MNEINIAYYRKKKKSISQIGNDILPLIGTVLFNISFQLPETMERTTIIIK